MIDSRVIPTVMAWLGHALHVFTCVREDVDAGPAPGMTMYQGEWVTLAVIAMCLNRTPWHETGHN
jgi:hypothetical protein